MHCKRDDLVTMEKEQASFVDIADSVRIYILMLICECLGEQPLTVVPLAFSIIPNFHLLW